MPTPDRRVALAITGALLVLVAVLLAWSAPAWPDDWDGLGFLASIDHFDLARFAPHPPGYPVYVALLRLAARLTPSAIVAADTVAVLSGVTALAALGAAMARMTGPGIGPRPGVDHAPAKPGTCRPIAAAVVVCVAACPLVWRCASGVGSEAPALALLALAAWAVSLRGPRSAVAAGALVGLGLGVRASWAPLYLPLLLFAPRGQRVRASVAALGAVLAWGVPFVLTVGPSQLVALSRTHLVGHASRWGGTALTEPSRVRYLARDLFVDGLGMDGDVLGLVLAFVGAVAIALALVAWRRASWRGAGSAAILLGPYLVWIAVGQNLRQEPRHSLPLVVAIALGLVLAAWFDRRARVPVVVLFLLCSVRTVTDARARCTIPPPAEQLVALVRTLPDRGTVAVFGGASARFFEGTDLAPRARAVGTLGDALLALDRMEWLPTRVLVTGEIDGLADSPYPLAPFVTLSRPPRNDRKQPTLVVYELLAPFLPAR
jgi:hypothetical protein